MRVERQLTHKAEVGGEGRRKRGKQGSRKKNKGSKICGSPRKLDPSAPAFTVSILIKMQASFGAPGRRNSSGRKCGEERDQPAWNENSSFTFTRELGKESLWYLGREPK